MIAPAALTGPLPELGVVLLALLAGLALVGAAPRVVAASVAGSLVLAPLLLLAAVWQSPQLRSLHRHPLYAVVIVLLGLGCVLLLAWGMVRRPTLVPLLAVIALPFRVPISLASTTYNLLVPLYLVVAAGSVAAVWWLLREGRLASGASPASWVRAPRTNPLEWLLALYIVLYAVQAIPSADFQKALQQTVFFYVPFALLFLLLREVSWTPRLTGACLGALAALAVAFSLIGFVEYSTKSLLLNSKLEVSNQLHTYFTVNSVFFDPDIFGRFLALVMVCLTAVLIHTRSRRMQLSTTAVLAVLWGCLVLTLSRSSLAALLLGLAILAAFRWRAAPVLAAGAVVLIVGVVAIAVAPRTFGLNQGLNGASSGRAGLVSGGMRLFKDRPVFGWGSASFVKQYRAHYAGTPPELAASHTTAVTIAAEQGVVGLLVYVTLVVAALLVLLPRARGDPARVAVAAAFIALVFHTQLYADFLEDPVTWALLGAGVALAAAARRRREGVAVSGAASSASAAMAA